MKRAMVLVFLFAIVVGCSHPSGNPKGGREKEGRKAEQKAVDDLKPSVPKAVQDVKEEGSKAQQKVIQDVQKETSKVEKTVVQGVQKEANQAEHKVLDELKDALPTEKSR